MDREGNVYATDMINDLIRKFSSTGGVIKTWDGEEEGYGKVDEPYGIAVDRGGNVYVADSSKHRILKFDSNGDYVNQWGKWGGGDEEFNEPYGVAVGRQRQYFRRG